jgi:hypothetical protein
MLNSDQNRVWTLIVAACLCALVQAGCGVPAPPPAPPAAPGGGPAPAAALPAIGAGDATVGETSATFGTWGDGKAILVWSAIPAGETGSGSTDAGAEYHGLHLAEDGGQIEWRCRTDDGTTGPVTINGESYDLSAGSLFLAGVEGGETTVVQLDRDTLQLTDEKLVGTLEDWMANDEDVHTFFAVKDEAPGE